MRASIISILNYFPRLKRVLRSIRNLYFIEPSISSGYLKFQDKEIPLQGQRLRNSWRDDNLPRRQRLIADQQLSKYRSGKKVDVFNVFVDALRDLPDLKPGTTLLEVGCSSGFYSEVAKIAELPILYSGCDYSEAFIRLAKEIYPSEDFAVADATALHFADCSFDMVVSGCCLLHIPEFTKGVEEAVRVARQYVIFHRTPVVWGMSDQWYQKKAYGVDTVEIHFNEDGFLGLLAKNGLELIATYTLSESAPSHSRIQGHAIRTYVCRKKYQ